MTRVKLDGFTLEKRWHGRVLQEIKDHKPVEVWKRDVRHHDSDPEVLVYHPVVEFPSAAEKAMYSKQWQPEFFEEQGITHQCAHEHCEAYRRLQSCAVFKNVFQIWLPLCRQLCKRRCAA